MKIPENRITFSDYEAFLEKLEREGRLDTIGQKNPKEINRRQDEEWIRDSIRREK